MDDIIPVTGWAKRNLINIIIKMSKKLILPQKQTKNNSKFERLLSE